MELEDLVLGHEVEVVVHRQPILRGGILHAPVVEHARGAVGRAHEDVVAHHEVGGGGGVVVEHEVGAVGVGALVVAPAVAGVHERVVLGENVAGAGRGVVVPVLEGVFGLPHHVVAPDDVEFGKRTAKRLAGEGRIVDLPQTVALHEVVAAVSPELDAVAEAHRIAMAGGGGLPVLESAAEPVDVAVADRDALRATAAEAVRAGVTDGEAVEHDVVATALVHHRDRLGEFNGLEHLAGVARALHHHAPLHGVVPVVELVLDLVGAPQSLDAPLLAVVEHDDAHVARNEAALIHRRLLQTKHLDVERAVGRHHVADAEVQGAVAAHAGHHHVNLLPRSRQR